MRIIGNKNKGFVLFSHLIINLFIISSLILILIGRQNNLENIVFRKEAFLSLNNYSFNCVNTIVRDIQANRIPRMTVHKFNQDSFDIICEIIEFESILKEISLEIRLSRRNMSRSFLVKLEDDKNMIKILSILEK